MKCCTGEITINRKNFRSFSASISLGCYSAGDTSVFVSCKTETTVDFRNQRFCSGFVITSTFDRTVPYYTQRNVWPPFYFAE